MMRPLLMDFPYDKIAAQQQYQYMFGKSLLVAPVTAPAKTWKVYLPAANEWYDLWTNKRFQGGQSILSAAPQDKIPVFVKAGSIIPFGKEMQYAGEKSNDTLEIRVYIGADARFSLYEDEGDNYGYENGNYSLVEFSWDQSAQTLSISDKHGSFPGSLTQRVFNVQFITGAYKDNSRGSQQIKSVNYNGRRVTVKRA